MLDPKNVKFGDEQFEEFVPSHLPKIADSIRIQYDYRHTNGKLFSTVAKSLELARERRDKWLKEQPNE